MLERYELNNKKAVITGGAGLLGVEHAEALLESGAHVILTDVSRSALMNAKERLSVKYAADRITCRNMDVTDVANINSVNKEFLEAGGIDILINNAAIDPKADKNGDLLDKSRFENFKLEEWDHQIRVGLTGAFLCSQTFGTSMASRGSGVILNISSDLSVISPDQRLYQRKDRDPDNQPVKPVTYSVIKTALVGMTRYLAAYWAQNGVRVNALSPGGVYNNQDEEFVLNLSKLIPMVRMARREEYRGAIQFLCSDASSYMTGQNIVIDGGRSIL